MTPSRSSQETRDTTSFEVRNAIGTVVCTCSHEALAREYVAKNTGGSRGELQAFRVRVTRQEWPLAAAQKLTLVGAGGLRAGRGARG